MASVSTNATNPAGVLNGLSHFFDAWVLRYRQYQVYTKTLSELSQLSERELLDLGISRSQIHTIAWDCAYCK